MSEENTDITFQYKIPEPWLIEAGIKAFSFSVSSYVSTPNNGYKTLIVKISDIKPPNRNPGVHTFVKRRMTDILKNIRTSTPMHPIEINPLEGDSNYKYCVEDGFHRYYASQQIGFTKIPAIIKPPQENWI
jgi:hypothetical protein